MPRLVSKILRISSLLALAAALAVGCTNANGEGSPPTSKPPSASTTSPVDVPLKGEYSYANAGLNATVKFVPGGSGATLSVKNATGRTIPKPGLYILTASAGKQVNGKVESSAPIPDGKTGDFKVTFPPEVRPDTIGLLILLIGPDNYGAFVPPAAG